GPTRGWAIVLRGPDRRLLATYPFVPAWKNPDEPQARKVIPFTYAVPESPNTARIEIVRAGSVLAHVDRTVSAPTLTVSAPRADSSAGRPSIHLAWRAKAT